MTENQPSHYSEWRRLANLRQGIICKLEKRTKRLESELATTKAALNAANARLALYEREAQ